MQYYGGRQFIGSFRIWCIALPECLKCSLESSPDIWNICGKRAHDSSVVSRILPFKVKDSQLPTATIVFLATFPVLFVFVIFLKLGQNMDRIFLYYPCYFCSLHSWTMSIGHMMNVRLKIPQNIITGPDGLM